MYDVDPAKTDPYAKAADLHSLLRCAMAAEENETSGLDWKGMERVLGLAERLAGELMEDVENLQRNSEAGGS